MKQSFQWLFNEVALRYEARIIPALGPLAADLVTWIEPKSQGIAVDLGTGTGIVARMLAPHIKQVIGLDLAYQMVATAHKLAPHTMFIQGDAYAIGLACESVDLIVSSFGLNATDPRRVFPEMYRILKPSGRVCFQEWSVLHLFDRILVDLLEFYAVDDEDAPDELVALRDFLAEDRLWYGYLQTEEDYEDELKLAGFSRIEVYEGRPVTVSMTVHELMQYKLAWTARSAELAAMNEETRRDFLDQFRSQLYEYADESGRVAYDPPLFRVQAIK